MTLSPCQLPVGVVSKSFEEYSQSSAETRERSVACMEDVAYDACGGLGCPRSGSEGHTR